MKSVPFIVKIKKGGPAKEDENVVWREVQTLCGQDGN